MSKTVFYLMNCKTHLHVGSGDSNYGVIDKLIQRDPSDGLPCVYGSSLKGALREYVEDALEKKAEAAKIFGDADGSKQRGTQIFHDALLLSIPQRSNQKLFYNATAQCALKKLKDIARLLGYSLPANLLSVIEKILKLSFDDKKSVLLFEKSLPATIRIEDFEKADIQISQEDVSALTPYLGNDIVLYKDEFFSAACNDYNLPIIARNNLENGQSKNLWYEQILPRESRLFFAVSTLPVNEGGDNDVNKYLNDATVQIGANATIGYGVSLITSIKAEK